MSQVYGGTTVPSSQTYGSGDLGVLGSVIQANTATGPNGAGVLYNDVMQNPTGNANLEFQPLLTAVPSAGTFMLYPDGSFSFTGAPNGNYTFKFIPKADGVAYATEQTVTINVGMVTSTVISDTAGSFVIRTAVAADSAGGFAIRATVVSNVTGGYTMAARVTTDIPGSFSLLNTVAANTAGGFAIRGTVQLDTAGAYTVRSQVMLDMSGAYTLRNQVLADLAGSFIVNLATSQVAASFSGAYSVRGQVQVDQTGDYAIRNQVVRNITGGYKVAGGVAVRPSAISYNVGGESRVVTIVEGMDQPFLPMSPGATLDFSFDWTDWLDGANIATAEISTEFYLSTSDVIVEEKGIKLLATLSEATPLSMGTRIRCKITTDEVYPRTDIRTIRLRAEDR